MEDADVGGCCSVAIVVLVAVSAVMDVVVSVGLGVGAGWQATSRRMTKRNKGFLIANIDPRIIGMNLMRYPV